MAQTLKKEKKNVKKKPNKQTNTVDKPYRLRFHEHML